MPFTPAHPAIVLPFLRWRYVSATGLVIGTISPDFEYFFKMSVDGIHGHTLPGIIYFDIPVTIFLAILFHRFIKTALIDNLPAFLQRKFSEVRGVDFISYLKRHWFVFLLSAAVGSALHIFWDSFTHMSGFFAQSIEPLKTDKFTFRGVHYPLWYALQHISTYIGLTIVTLYVFLIKPDKSLPVTKPTINYWLIIIVAMAIVLFFRFYWLPASLNLGNFVVSAITAFCLALLIAGRFSYANSTKIG